MCLLNFQAQIFFFALLIYKEEILFKKILNLLTREKEQEEKLKDE